MKGLLFMLVGACFLVLSLCCLAFGTGGGLSVDDQQLMALTGGATLFLGLWFVVLSITIDTR